MNTMQPTQVTKIIRMKSVDLFRMYKKLSAKQTNNQTNKQTTVPQSNSASALRTFDVDSQTKSYQS